MADNLPLVLVDGSSFLYRAFYASKQSFTNSKGVPTGVSMIMTRMMQGLLKKFKGSKFIVVFDAKGKSFRADLYAEYKANRPPMPDALKVQVDYVHAIVKALGFPLVSITGVEADDVLGTYAKKATSLGLKTIICTGDKDLSQLVNDDVILYDSMKDVFYDEKGVIEKFGVPPKLIIDFLALKGDSSDNIPGMAGVGDKTAISLLNEIGSIDEIAKNTDKIASLSFRGSKTFAQKFIESLDVVKLSYTLATIKTDVDLDLSIESVTEPVADIAKLSEIYTELEFTKLLEQLKQEHSEVTSSTNDQVHTNNQAKAIADVKQPSMLDLFSSTTTALSDYKSLNSKFTLVLDEKTLDEVCQKIIDKKLVAVDTETNSLSPKDCQIVGMSLSVGNNEGYYIPFNHTYIGVPTQLKFETVKNKLEPILNKTDVKVIGHNIKFDLLVLHYQGLEINKVYADTMVLAHLLDSSSLVNMDDLAKKELCYKTITYKEVTGDKKKLLISQVSLDEVCNYAAEDALVTFNLYEVLSKKLDSDATDKDLFFNLEMPFLHVLYKMELEGVYVDQKELETQNQALKVELVDIQKQIYVACGQEFNISSPKQLAKVLFEDLKIPYPKKVKDNKYSTAEEILEAISYDYDVANLVLRYRELSKLISTYTEKLQTLIDDNTHRIYTSFNQCGTVTGRLSSSDPNLQNIPARTHEGKLIRKAFVAPTGY